LAKKKFLKIFYRKEHENSEDHQDEESYVKTAELSIVHKKFCLELHEQCLALKNVAEKFDTIASEIEAIQEKANALVDLANLSNSQVVTLVKYLNWTLHQSFINSLFSMHD
jgi:hypothetical protein